MKLVYKNLVIRKARSDDAEQLCAWWSDGKIMAIMGSPDGIRCTPEEIREGLDQTNYHIIELDGKPIGEMNYDDFCLPKSIIERDGKPIGEMEYRSMEGAAELGIKICDFSAQEKGYGTTLLTIFIDALFRYYGYEEMILDTGIKNERAQHVYEKKLGFRRVGMEKCDNPDELGIYAYIVYFRMNKIEWFASRKEPLEYIYSAE
ncbi:MAG: GNAT family N-acetyltransferase [Oscillospiraceae bacterium]|nr:GNAT family N-acetyltransferase [Oscillospiraceae bacterium]